MLFSEFVVEYLYQVSCLGSQRVCYLFFYLWLVRPVFTEFVDYLHREEGVVEGIIDLFL